jgi:hypothetical protein
MVKLTKKFSGGKTLSHVINNSTITYTDKGGYLSQSDLVKSLNTLNKRVRIPEDLTINIIENPDSEYIELVLVRMRQWIAFKMELDSDSDLRLYGDTIGTKRVPYSEVFKDVDESYASTGFPILEWFFKSYKI